MTGMWGLSPMIYQVVEDVNVANEVFANDLPERSRPWHG